MTTSRGGQPEGGGHEAAAAQLTLKLHSQAVTAPGPAQMAEQRQSAKHNQQAHEQLQHKLQHGVALWPVQF